MCWILLLISLIIGFVTNYQKDKDIDQMTDILAECEAKGLLIIEDGGNDDTSK